VSTTTKRATDPKRLRTARRLGALLTGVNPPKFAHRVDVPRRAKLSPQPRGPSYRPRNDPSQHPAGSGYFLSLCPLHRRLYVKTAQHFPSLDQCSPSAFNRFASRSSILKSGKYKTSCSALTRSSPNPRSTKMSKIRFNSFTRAIWGRPWIVKPGHTRPEAAEGEAASAVPIEKLLR
jgi:hypothetical protein